jgi:hypothetical protein
MTRWILAVAVAVVAGCGDKDDTGFDYTQFGAGGFQFTSMAVSDVCLDGAFGILFLPEGSGSQSDWAYPVDLPAWSGLPSTYSVQLQAPFAQTEVTVEEGGVGVFLLNGVEQYGVEFDADNYPGCLVDLDISAELSIDSDESLTGSADMFVGNPVGDTCPTFSETPCRVVLDFVATRL